MASPVADLPIARPIRQTAAGMRGFFFWESGGDLRLGGRSNQYGALLARSLRRHGIDLEPGDYAFGADWLERSRPDYSVLHLNWLDRFYIQGQPGEALGEFARFAETLIHAKRIGYRIVWTVHNLFPHERAHPELDRLVNLLVAREADAVIAHCRYGAEQITRRYGADPVHVIPHGHFMDVFPDRVARPEARARLGIDGDRFAYLYFGNLREYKGVEELIAAFRQIARPHDLLVLMMKTNARAPGLMERLTAGARDRSSIRIYTSDFFAEEEFQFYLNAADAAVLPFREVMTSGTAIQALGFGLPVVLPRRGCLAELIDETMGVLYDPDAPGALPAAMRRVREIDLEAAGSAARARARRFDWNEVGDRTAALYRGATDGR